MEITTDKSWNIRAASKADLEPWFALRMTLWPDADSPEELQEMAKIIESPQREAFVAQDTEGKLIGFLEANIRSTVDGCYSEGVGYIEGWFVAAEWRQQGVGAALVKAAEAWARSKGCIEMGSDCELDNTLSLKAHLSLGYTEQSRLIHFRKSLD